MTENTRPGADPHPTPEAFFAALQEEIAVHPALSHPFLIRFSEEPLSITQLRTFAVQHYMYSRFFTRNLAAVISNTPDEQARSLLIMNMYEEIGEPMRLRDRMHILLLEAGLVKADDVGTACVDVLDKGQNGDVVQVLIERGHVTRDQVLAVSAEAARKAKDVTHPALFRRFLRSLGLGPESLDSFEPLPETTRVISEYQEVCRKGHWLGAMGAMGPGTECVVPTLYVYLEQGIAKSGGVSKEDYIFWTIHIHCDDGHGQNIMDAIRPYVTTKENQDRVTAGARRVLDARAAWFDGLHRAVFGTKTPTASQAPRPLSRALRISRVPKR